MQVTEKMTNWRNWAFGIIPGGIASYYFRLTVWSFYPDWVSQHNWFSWLALVPAVLILLGIILFANYCYVRWRRSRHLKSTDFFEALEHNPSDDKNEYSPISILSRPRLTSLDVLCNGSSKWTYKQKQAEIEFHIARHAQIDCPMRFLVCCPDYLMSLKTTKAKEKAINNAKNIKSLHAVFEKLGLTEKCKVKVYRHNPSLRMIIVSSEQVVLGHYTKSGLENSEESPLMIFKCVNNWGFGGAYISYFNSEWARGFDIATEDWNRYAEIQKMTVG